METTAEPGRPGHLAAGRPLAPPTAPPRAGNAPPPAPPRGAVPLAAALAWRGSESPEQPAPAAAGVSLPGSRRWRRPGARSPRARPDQAAQMRAPLCLLLLVAHAADMLPLNRRRKQGSGAGAGWPGRQAGRRGRPSRHLPGAPCPGLLTPPGGSQSHFTDEETEAPWHLSQAGPRRLWEERKGLAGLSHCPHSL